MKYIIFYEETPEKMQEVLTRLNEPYIQAICYKPEGLTPLETLSLNDVEEKGGWQISYFNDLNKLFEDIREITAIYSRAKEHGPTPLQLLDSGQGKLVKEEGKYSIIPLEGSVYKTDIEILNDLLGNYQTGEGPYGSFY